MDAQDKILAKLEAIENRQDEHKESIDDIRDTLVEQGKAIASIQTSIKQYYDYDRKELFEAKDCHSRKINKIIGVGIAMAAILGGLSSLLFYIK